MPASTAPALRLSRQPILDDGGRVFGYQLRHDLGERAGDESPADGARVLTTAIGSLGLDVVTGGRPAFVHFDLPMLLGGAATLLPPTALVVELPAGVAGHPAALEACRQLAERGYALGLDRLGNDDATPLLPYLRFLRVDMRDAAAVARVPLHAVLPARGIRLVGHRVDTAELRAEAFALGCRLFQGRFLFTPTSMAAPSPAAPHAAYVRLLHALNRPEASQGEIEALVKAEPMLVYQMLRAVNSAAFPVPRRLASVREALFLLGREQVRRWVTVWALAALAPQVNREALRVGLTRARSCEWLGAGCMPDVSSELFLAGLCSALAPAIGYSAAELAGVLPLSELIIDALQRRRGAVGAVLEAVIAHEHGQWHDAAAAAGRAGLAAELLTDAHLEAVRWTHLMDGLL